MNNDVFPRIGDELLHRDRLGLRSTGDLHGKLMEAYAVRFSSLKMNVPFDDVIISKMVFQ